MVKLRNEYSDSLLMSKLFYLAKNGESFGPWGKDEAMQRIRCGEFEPTDYFYCEIEQDWKMLLDSLDFKDLFNKKKSQIDLPKPPPAGWFILRGENKFGPYSYKDIVSMLQESKAFEYDFVWTQGMERWRRIAEIEDFKGEKIRCISEGPAQFRRHHIRVSCGASLIFHNNQKLFRGIGIEISSGGVGFVSGESCLEVGERIFLHFSPGNGIPPFNALCEIMSTRIQKDQSVRYGVKFLDLAEEARSLVHQFIKKQAA